MNNNGCGGKNRIDRKISELQIEINKPKKFQNLFKIRRLKQSIKRNKKISNGFSKRRKNKWNK